MSSAEQAPAPLPIPLLEKIRTEGRAWEVLAAEYGVENPNPPWQTSLQGTCDALASDICALPALDRRHSEDALSESLYRDVPAPERQLLALTHTLIERGLIDENTLAERIQQVRHRLEAV